MLAQKRKYPTMSKLCDSIPSCTHKGTDDLSNTYIFCICFTYMIKSNGNAHCSYLSVRDVAKKTWVRDQEK